jgi:hypothetical protein
MLLISSCLFEYRNNLQSLFVLIETSIPIFVTNKSQSLKERQLMKETFPIKKIGDENDHTIIRRETTRGEVYE